MKKRTTQLFIAILTTILLSSQAFAVRPIKGSICYQDNESNPIPNVVVELLENGVHIATTTTNFNGKYIFPNIPYGTYTVRALSTSIDPGGIELADADLITSYLGSYTSLTDIQLLAANVNGDNIVDEADAMAIATYWSNPSFTPEWVFGEERIVEHNGNKTNVPPMGGSSSGDVNGTFVPTGRTEVLAEVSYFQKYFSTDFSIEVYAEDITSASAMGLVIDYPSMVNVNSVTSQLGDLTNLKIINNQIVATWISGMPANINSNEPILVISGSANQNYNGSDIKFTIDSKSHFVKNGEVIRPVFTVPYLTVSDDYLSNSYPNPANETATVYFNLPNDSKATLNVYNQNGQLVRSILNDYMSAGHHTAVISVSELQNGVYFYSLKTNGSSSINQTKKLIVVH